MVDVVICYSRENQATARQLAEGISRLGYEVWRDEEAGSEAESTERVSDRIAGAKAAIVIWSAASAASEWIKSEAILARGLKRLIQASADDRPPPIPFDPGQVASISSWLGDDNHPGWASIKASLAGLAGPPTAGAVADETVRSDSPAAAFSTAPPGEPAPPGGDDEAKTVIGFAPLPPIPPAEPVPPPEQVAPTAPPAPAAAPPPPEPVAPPAPPPEAVTPPPAPPEPVTPPPTPEPPAPPAVDPLAATAVPGAAAAAAAAAASTPPAPATPPAPTAAATPAAGAAPPKKGKGGLILFLLLVLLAAAGGGGYYYYQNYWLPAHPPTAETPPPGQEAAPTEPEFPPGFTPPANGQATAPTPPPPPEQFDREAVIAGTNPVVIHSGPTDLGIAVGRIAPGEVFSTFVQTGDFWRVRTAGGTLGYINANVVRLRDAPALPGAAPGTTPGTTPRTTASTTTPGTTTRPTTRPNRTPTRPSRINRNNSAVMVAYCRNAGRGTEQCRSFQAEGGR
jgi:hypothetical protein